MTSNLPAVKESPDCGSDPTSYTKYQLKSTESNLAKESIETAIIFDADQAKVYINTDNYSFVNQVVTLRIGIARTTDEVFRTQDLLLNIAFEADALGFDMSTF